MKEGRGDPMRCRAGTPPFNDEAVLRKVGSSRTRSVVRCVAPAVARPGGSVRANNKAEPYGKGVSILRTGKYVCSFSFNRTEDSSATSKRERGGKGGRLAPEAPRTVLVQAPEDTDAWTCIEDIKVWGTRGNEWLVQHGCAACGMGERTGTCS